jgi:hypothetical protein
VDQATIDGCVAKTDRAEAAVNEMTTELVAWLDTNPYPARVNENRKAGEYGLYLDFSVPLPLRFSARIGEVAHDLRSALDHLIWGEAVELVGYKRADKDRPAFPLLTSRVAFKKSEVKRYVSPDAWTVIERHQPYSRGKPKRSRVLLVLHEINRIDKHRALNIGVAGLPNLIKPLALIDWNPDARMTAPPLVGIPAFKRLKRETEVARYFFDAAGPEPNVRMKKTPPLHVSFGDLPRKLRGAAITQTIREVRQVVKDFAALVP